MLDEKTTEQILTYCLVILLATFSGIVKSIRKFQKNGEIVSIKHVIIRSSGDIILSLFAGLMMFLWLQGNSYQPLTPKSAFYISIASYMGVQAIDIFVAIWKVIHDRGRHDSNK